MAKNHTFAGLTLKPMHSLDEAVDYLGMDFTPEIVPATYPWDGTDPAALLRHADALALKSKRSGKNVITFGPE